MNDKIGISEWIETNLGEGTDGKNIDFFDKLLLPPDFIIQRVPEGTMLHTPDTPNKPIPKGSKLLIPDNSKLHTADDIYDRKIINYICSLLSSQQSLLARNRAYFISISIALAGIGTSNILIVVSQLLDKGYNLTPSELYKFFGTLILVSIAGFVANYSGK